MFSKIVYASMYFFNTNPSGRILNRFSKDTGAVDEILPMTALDVMQVCTFNFLTSKLMFFVFRSDATF